MQERYWRFLVQLKADCFYTEEYVIASEAWDTRITIFNALVASGSVSAWAVWQKFDWFWAVLVATSQVLAVLKQHLPFKKRITPLRTTSLLYDEIYIKAESRWFDVSTGKLTEREINNLLYGFIAEQSKAWKKCIGNLVLPMNSSVQKRADLLTAEYFRQTYKLEPTIRQ